jgi:AAA domain
VGFLKEKRRLNVAMTRARKQLVSHAFSEVMTADLFKLRFSVLLETVVPYDMGVHISSRGWNGLRRMRK